MRFQVLGLLLLWFLIWSSFRQAYLEYLQVLCDAKLNEFKDKVEHFFFFDESIDNGKKGNFSSLAGKYILMIYFSQNIKNKYCIICSQFRMVSNVQKELKIKGLKLIC
jgi:sulfur relay (sulfurtransferase) complex TusBCD TusD component (DsrE family)